MEGKFYKLSLIRLSLVFVGVKKRNGNRALVSKIMHNYSFSIKMTLLFGEESFLKLKFYFRAKLGEAFGFAEYFMHNNGLSYCLLVER